MRYYWCFFLASSLSGGLRALEITMENQIGRQGKKSLLLSSGSASGAPQ